MGQCFGVDDKGARIPVTKGTQLAPGLRLETGPNSYAQVKLGQDTAFGIGERSRVGFDRRDRGRDVVILDQGRIRMVGGEAIGRPATRPVELHTVDGNFVLSSADIEVKTPPRTGDALPAPTLVKLNIGDARLGDLQVTKDAVQGIVGGKILDRIIPIGDIALPPLRRDPAPAGPGGVSLQPVGPPLIALPVINLPATEPRPFVTPIAVSPAIVSPEISRPTTNLTPVFQPVMMTPVVTAPVVPVSSLVLAQPITTAAGTTSLNTLAKAIASSPTPTPTVSAPLATTVLLQPTATTRTILSPRLLTLGK
jgi:hypothetical protein